MSKRINPIKFAVGALCSTLFMVAGVYHFLKPDVFQRAMPNWIPAQYPLIYLTGIFEIAGAIGLAIPKLQKLTSRCLAVFLVAVFPVNIHMALNSQLFPQFSPSLLWWRLPLQFVLIATVLWVGGNKKSASAKEQ